jgi:putative flippase GtrA
MAKTRENLYLLLTPRGLGVSLIKGYKYAIEKLKADVVIPNDVDFQWHPKYIPQMLKKIEEGYDVVVPSRHVPGGEDNFNWFRKLTHFVSNTLINHYWAGIREVKDLAGNFKAIRVKGILEKVDFNRLDIKGFVIQPTMIYELSKTGAKFCEIPAIYEERRAGETKVGLNIQFIKDVIETVLNATKIRIERSAQFLKFAIVGFIGYLVNAGGLELFYRLGLGPGPAAALGAEMAIISNFTLNNLWTFAAKRIVSWRKIPLKFIQFNLTSIGAVVIQWVVVGMGTALFGDQWRQILLIIAIGFFIIPYNYFMYTTFIWKTRKSRLFGWLQKRLG